jgi:hypothetical protein
MKNALIILICLIANTLFAHNSNEHAPLNFNSLINAHEIQAISIINNRLFDNFSELSLK